MVSAEFNVVAHHVQIHSNDFHREGIGLEFNFNVDCTADDAGDVCFGCRQLASLDYIRHAKLQWSPSSSSWLMSLLLKLKLRPGMTLCFLSQKMAQKEPTQKKTPLTAANAGVVGVTPHTTPFEGPVGIALDAWHCFNNDM